MLLPIECQWSNMEGTVAALPVHTTCRWYSGSRSSKPDSYLSVPIRTLEREDSRTLTIKESYRPQILMRLWELLARPVFSVLPIIFLLGELR